MFFNDGVLECYPDCFCEKSGPFGSLFWSSGAYFVSSFLLYLRTRTRSLEFEFWTFTTLTLAISSFLFHAAQTLETVALDYASIAMTLIFFPFWGRLQKLSRRKLELAFYALYAVFWLIFLKLSFPARVGLSLTLFTGVVLTLRKEVVRLRFHGYLQASVFLGIVSFLFFLLEETLLSCDPQSWFQAHSIWHVGSAGALYLYGRWRFPD